MIISSGTILSVYCKKNYYTTAGTKKTLKVHLIVSPIYKIYIYTMFTTMYMNKHYSKKNHTSDLDDNNNNKFSGDVTRNKKV